MAEPVVVQAMGTTRYALSTLFIKYNTPPVLSVPTVEYGFFNPFKLKLQLGQPIQVTPIRTPC